MMESKPWLAHYDAGVPSTLEYPQLTLDRLFEKTAKDYPDRACTIFSDVEISYRHMSQAAHAFAEGLRSEGVSKGARVGILLSNVPQFITAYYGILMAGGIVVAINPQYKPRELLFQITDAGVERIIALSSAYPLLNQIREQAGIRQVILTDLEESRSGSPDYLFQLSADLLEKHKELDLKQSDRWMSDLVQKATGRFPGSQVGPDDVAIFQYTGGTTGIPKGAVGLHRNLVANTLQFRRWLVNLENGQEKVLVAIPLFHVYGMVLGMNLAVALGASMVLIPNARDLANLLSTIEKHRPTVFPGVPMIYNAINHYPDAQAGKYDLRSIKACISGSSPLLRETKDRFEALTGGKLVEGYGLSEAPTATHCNPILGENRPGSIGLPLPDVDCLIVDLEDGRTELPVGEVGELVIRGPQVMSGYHDMPEETIAALLDGWLHTGDIARMDQDGYFYLVDRKKELIKVSGFQVWPREVEEVIATHPKVQEVGVAGIPDEDRGEAVKAWVVLKTGQTANEEEIRVWCQALLTGYKVPTLVEFREELPKTTVGKVLRRELVRQHNERFGQALP